MIVYPYIKSLEYMTAKKLGFQKNDYALSKSSGWVHKLVGFVNTETPLCEVWGFCHEFGSAYADDLTKISKEEALQRIKEALLIYCKQ